MNQPACHPIFVTATHERGVIRARELAPKLDHGRVLDWPIDRLPELGFLLTYDERGASLQQLDMPKLSPLRVSFDRGHAQHRRRFGGGLGQDLSKAIGLPLKRDLHVVDATAGLGRDAFVMASLGARVTLVERNWLIAELLREGMLSAKEPEACEIISRMNLAVEVSEVYLDRLAQKADVVYLDPMYPHRQKSSLVKKDMRMLQAIVEDPSNESDLLDSAITHAEYRVVVKRPVKGLCLGGEPPSYQIKGKSTRFDVYAIKSMKS